MLQEHVATLRYSDWGLVKQKQSSIKINCSRPLTGAVCDGTCLLLSFLRNSMLAGHVARLPLPGRNRLEQAGLIEKFTARQVETLLAGLDLHSSVHQAAWFVPNVAGGSTSVEGVSCHHHPADNGG